MKLPKTLMNKAELLSWLHERHTAWKSVADQFTPSTWELSGVAGYWSMKDVLAHLTGWNKRLVNDLAAVKDGKPKPPPPWPAHLETDDEVNKWIYETNLNHSVQELLDEDEQVFKKLVEIV